ncbi:unnamed protein product [Heligmosomoides polygyrus]|uniref:Pre-mRNA-splicing factor SLU7 n=1 Tax=Heligmosomoides polygyrus TaxID=6339 RepID=A0A3P7YP00_HELPZ|nr:unnamed protein product [Heligmosomoides polygyrus]
MEQATTKLEIVRLTGPPKEDKLVIQWAEVGRRAMSLRGCFNDRPSDLLGGMFTKEDQPIHQDIHRRGPRRFTEKFTEENLMKWTRDKTEYNWSTYQEAKKVDKEAVAKATHYYDVNEELV